MAILGEYALQLGMTTFGAWIAVQWSLGRFKSEKTWERQIDTLAAIIQSLSEIERVLSEWVKEVGTGDDLPLDKRNALHQSYEAALRDFDRACAVGSIVLPATAVAATDGAKKALSSREGNDYFEHLDNRHGRILQARRSLIETGQLLGAPPSWRCRLRPR